MLRKEGNKMKSKHIKLFFELSFIFILPFIMILINYKLKKTYTYNTDLVSSEVTTFQQDINVYMFKESSPIFKIVDLFYDKLGFQKTVFNYKMPIYYDYPCLVIFNFCFWHCIYVLLDFIPHLIRGKEKE